MVKGRHGPSFVHSLGAVANGVPFGCCESDENYDSRARSSSHLNASAHGNEWLDIESLTLGAEDIGKRIRPAEGARFFIPLVRVFIPLVNVADTASAITLSARGSKLSTGSI